MMRFLWLVAGFHYVPIKGKQATRKEAAIFVTAPHSSFVDILPVVKIGSPTVVAKKEIGLTPIFGSTLSHRQTDVRVLYTYVAYAHTCILKKKKTPLFLFDNNLYVRLAAWIYL